MEPLVQCWILCLPVVKPLLERKLSPKATCSIVGQCFLIPSQNWPSFLGRWARLQPIKEFHPEKLFVLEYKLFSNDHPSLFSFRDVLLGLHFLTGYFVSVCIHVVSNVSSIARHLAKLSFTKLTVSTLPIGF